MSSPEIIREWAIHHNRGRPHSALGSGLSEPVSDQVPPNEHRHRLPAGYGCVKRSVVGGLHHEYGLVEEAAWKRISFLRTTRIRRWAGTSHNHVPKPCRAAAMDIACRLATGGEHAHSRRIPSSGSA